MSKIDILFGIAITLLVIALFGAIFFGIRDYNTYKNHCEENGGKFTTAQTCVIGVTEYKLLNINPIFSFNIKPKLAKIGVSLE